MRSILLLALCAGCGATTTSTTTPTATAKPTAAPTATATATAAATASATAAPTAAPTATPTASEASCNGDRCELTEVSDATVAQLERLSREDVDLTFTAGATNASLKTLAKVPWVRHVHIQSPDVTDLAPLAALDHLNELDLHGAQGIADLKPIADRTTVTSLNLAGTKVADIAPLAKLSGLEELDLSGTAVTDIAPLRQLKSLRKLNLAGLKIGDYKPLAELTSLEKLTLPGTSWKDAGKLEKLTKLRYLDLGHSTKLKDIGTLMHLKGLETIDLTDAPIEDVLPLSTLAKITTIHLGGTHVKSFRGLMASANAHALRYLGVPKGTKEAFTADLKSADPGLEVHEE